MLSDEEKPEKLSLTTLAHVYFCADGQHTFERIILEKFSNYDTINQVHFPL